MRTFFRSLLIKQKLLLIITMTSTIVLLLAFAAFFINNFYVFNAKQKSNLAILAEILADNSQAAVSFNDQAAADELLSALRAEKHIAAAVIYMKDGEVLAHYHVAEPPSLEKGVIGQKQFYKDHHLHTYRPIVLDKQTIGMVYLRTDVAELYELIKNYMLFGLLIIIVAIAASFVIADRLQNTISAPITHLTEVAEAVSRNKNYSLRATLRNNDEIGTLTNRFNEMMAEIQKREEALIRTNEALMRSNEDLEQFAYVASHDLQEPIRMVINYVELLAEGMQDSQNAETKEFLSFIMEGASRSRQLIGDLLQYSRVRPDAKWEEVDTGAMLQKALGNLQFAIEESKAKITHDPLPKIYADPGKFWQIFQNLIANAIKFKKNDETPVIHIGAKNQNGGWLFSVSDNGIGIDPKYQERIFVIFKRLHNREKYPGTGIGLAICKRIIEQHSGKIWVQSEPNRGSTFYFTIPLLNKAG